MKKNFANALRLLSFHKKCSEYLQIRQERGDNGMKQDEMRSRLIDGTIHIIACEGMDKATTKQISKATSMNEAYIYRCFADKEDMLAKTFASLDDELADKFAEQIPGMYNEEIPFEQRCRNLFFSMWDFLVGNREKCLTYVRYFYSPYFNRNSFEDHRKRFWPLVNTLRIVFKDEADVWMILNHILNVMLSFAVLVHNGHMPENDDYAEHVFRVIYRSVEQYFKKPEEKQV